MRIILQSMVILVALTTSSCNKKCAGLESSIDGAIEATYQFGDCDFFAAIDSNLIIRSQAEFDSFVDGRMKNCSSLNTIPAVDFQKNTLIGNMVSTAACNVAFKRNLSVDHVAKVYTYTITIEKCAGCNQLLRSPNFVLTPPIPTNYSMKWVIVSP